MKIKSNKLSRPAMAMVVAIIAGLFLSACTTYVTPVRPGPRHGHPWVPGHYNRFGAWVPGHYR